MILGLAQSLFRMFREKSDVVPVSRLKKQGVRTVTVLDWDRMQSLISTAVEEALRRRGAELSPEALASVNEEAREVFARLVDERDTYRDSARNLQSEKKQLVQNLEALRTQLTVSTGDLNRERTAVLTTDDIGVDAAGIASYRSRLQREIERLLAESGSTNGHDLASRLSTLAGTLLNEEKQAALESARVEQEHRARQLERRIEKLQKSLHATESMVERLQRTKSGDDGVESIYREVQGIDPTEHRINEKKGLLEEIFRLNLELRQVIEESSGKDAGRRDGLRPDRQALAAGAAYEMEAE